MKKTVDKKTPAYLQLYAQVRDKIVKGIYPFNSKLPSKRTASAEYGISTVTVEHAYSLLCEEGYVEPHERSGYYVIFRESDGFEMSVGANKVDFVAHPRTSQSVEFPFSVLAKTMRSVISEYGESLLERSHEQGCDELRNAISQYLARSRGISCDPSQIIVGSGSEYLYRIIVELLGRDKLSAVESPSYNKIEQVYRTSAARCELLPLGPDGIKSSALKKYLADCKDEHCQLADEIQTLLDKYSDDGKNPNPIAKGMSWMKTGVKLAVDESDATIADLMTDGCNMGVKSLNRYLNEYKAADEVSKDITKRLINLEERLAIDIRDYL